VLLEVAGLSKQSGRGLQGFAGLAFAVGSVIAIVAIRYGK
jgi:hypothetical protein